MINIHTLIIRTRWRDIDSITCNRINLRIIIRNGLTSIFIYANNQTTSVALIIGFNMEMKTRNSHLRERIQLNMTRILLRLPSVIRTVFGNVTRNMMDTIMMLPLQIPRIFIIKSVARQRISLNTLSQRGLTNSTNVITYRLQRGHRFNI